MGPGTPVWLWAVVSAATIAVVVAFRVRPWRRSARDEPSLAWFLAGSGSAAVLMLTVLRLIEALALAPAMALSVGGVVLAGVLTGWLLGVGLTPREHRPV